MKITILLALLILSTTCWSQEIAFRIENVENGLTTSAIENSEQKFTRSNIQQKMLQDKIHGISVAVVNNGEIEWSKGYGVSQFGGATEITTNALFQCASIGKVITSLAVLKLVEAGKIDLDEDVNDKLRRWKIKDNEYTKTQKVTPRHLLSHSAGLADRYGFLGYDPKSAIPTLEQILNNSPISNAKKSLAIKAIPGKVEKYSGGGYLILQLLIEDVSGTTYSDYVQKHIFEPLEMTHSTYDHQPDKNLQMPIAAGHYSNGKTLKNKNYHIYPEKAAAGPWTTAEDLARLIIGIQNAFKGESSAILSESLTHELLSAQINNKGLGVNLKGIEKPEAFWHAGQNLGYTGLFYGLIGEGKGAVILLNSDGGERFMQEFITSVANEYEWPVMKSYQSLEISPALQESLMGKYSGTDPSQSLSVEVHKDRLVVQPFGSKKRYKLLRIDSNHYTFQNAQDYYKISFDNKSTSLIYTESIGKTVELKKGRLGYWFKIVITTYVVHFKYDIGM